MKAQRRQTASSFFFFPPTAATMIFILPPRSSSIEPVAGSTERFDLSRHAKSIRPSKVPCQASWRSLNPLSITSCYASLLAIYRSFVFTFQGSENFGRLEAGVRITEPPVLSALSSKLSKMNNRISENSCFTRSRHGMSGMEQRPRR